MIEGQTLLNIREVNSYQSEEIRSMKDRIRLLETQEFPFVRHRDFDAKGDLVVGSADNTYNNLTVGANDTILIADSAQTLGVKWGTIPTAGITDLAVTTAKLADGAVTTIKITDANVTNAKLANMAQATVKGRASAAGTGVPVDLTATQLNVIVGTVALESTSTISATGALTSKGAAAAVNLHNRATNALSSGIYSPTAGTFYVYDYVAGAVRLIIDGSGNAAMNGTFASGAITATGTITATGAISATGAVTTKGAAAAMNMHNRSTNALSVGLYSPTPGDCYFYDYVAGQVRMIIDSVGSFAVAYDSDITSYFGRIVFGNGTYSDYAAFSHLDNNTATGYFAMQHGPTGNGYINAKTGASIFLRINNTTVATVSGTGLAVTGDLTVSDDLAVTDLATAGSLGVGISSVSTGKAHIYNAASTASPASIAILTVENDDAMAIQLLNGGNEQAIYFGDNVDNDAGRLRYWHSDDDWELVAAGTTRIRYDSSANTWRPTTDAGQSLGMSGMRWNEVWAADGSINTSDEREKRNVKPSDLGLDFITRLRPISWVWQDKPAYEIDETDDGKPIKQTVPGRKYKRPHYGLSAQQVRRVLDDVGVADFAGYIHDQKTDVYALRYTEFIAPLIMAVQELKQQIEELKN